MLPAIVASSATSVASSPALAFLAKWGVILGILVLAYIFGKREWDKYKKEQDEKKKTNESKEVYDDANTPTESGAASAMARKLYSEINEPYFSTLMADDQKIIRLGMQVADLKKVADAYEKLSKGLILDKELNRVMSASEVQEFYANVKAWGGKGYDANGRRIVLNGVYSNDYNQKLALNAIALLNPDYTFFRGQIDWHKITSIGYKIYSDKFYAYFRSECKKQFGKEYDFLTDVKKAFGDYSQYYDEILKAIEFNKNAVPTP